MQWQWVYSIEFAVCFRQSCVTDDPGSGEMPLLAFDDFQQFRCGDSVEAP